MNIANDVEIAGFGFPGHWRAGGMRHVPQHMHTPFAPPSTVPVAPSSGWHPAAPRHHHVDPRRSRHFHGADVEFLGDGLVTFMGPLDSVKASFAEHKKFWIAGGIAAALGVGYLLMKRS